MASTVDVNLNSYDPIQAELMEERCILINEKDEAIGHESKKECHLMTNINKGLLHRAFSVFLFNTKGELLLQQRAAEKITFPEYWTNTCCSHPLHTPDEIVEKDQLGVRTAAQRKLEHELGIKPEEVPLDAFKYLTRIQYAAPSDTIWGESEIDYILFLKKDIAIKPSPNEVMATKYVTKEELRDMVTNAGTGGVKLTPWFKLIVDNFLWKWWDALEDGTLDSHVDDKIHKM